ncbi:hypothetical protein [Flavobacterium sp.]|uniref:hypothetical protein n=1 Tax=Flavobacterium sp. TaxID=239 RepID=UPI00120FDF89|nr:hypothetical protein [Flavobacterium sp.]RZJ69803.1 MAG: hypothetical protein EOO49_16230 [Flavobacterium sp.]
MDAILEELKKYFRDTPQDQIQRDWAETEKFKTVGPTVHEYMNATKRYLDLDGWRIKNQNLILVNPKQTFGFLI